MTDLPPSLSAGLVYRSHCANGAMSRVWYSPCDQYRYGLSRVWNESAPALLFIMLNPSTADELLNDPTVARCETRARSMGFGGVCIANLFAFRATRPQDLKLAAEPIGAANTAVLEHWIRLSGMTIAAWGVHGGHQDRGRAFAEETPAELHHLGLTKDEHPRHPLYVALATEPKPWPYPERYNRGI